MDNLERIHDVLTRDENWDGGIRLIKNKEECYAFYEEGFFGNKPLTWNSYDEILASGWNGNVCMRSKKGMGVKRNQTTYNVPLEKVPDEIRKWEEVGFPAKTIAFNQSMPDDQLLIQGEYSDWNCCAFKNLFPKKKGESEQERYDRSPWSVGLDSLLYTRVKEPMNLALAKETIYVGGTFLVRKILEENLSPSSYANLRKLSEVFPRSSVEFSAYKKFVGNLPDENTIIWEVRNY